MRGKLLGMIHIFLKNEILLILRSRESYISVIFFSLLIVVVFQFSLSTDRQTTMLLVGPMVWLTTLFGSMLRMNRTFDGENEGGLFDAFRLIKGAALPLFLSKFIINVFLVLSDYSHQPSTY